MYNEEVIHLAISDMPVDNPPSPTAEVIYSPTYFICIRLTRFINHSTIRMTF